MMMFLKIKWKSALKCLTTCLAARLLYKRSIFIVIFISNEVVHWKVSVLSFLSVSLPPLSFFSPFFLQTGNHVSESSFKLTMKLERALNFGSSILLECLQVWATGSDLMCC